MATSVLDSWAVLAFFKGKAAAEEVETLLWKAADRGEPLLLSVVNWSEVFYTLLRSGGRSRAEEAMSELATLPIDVIGARDDLKLARTAAQLKAGNRLSLADAFGAALAKEHRAEFVTGDPEFRAVEGKIRIRWLTPSRRT